MTPEALGYERTDWGVYLNLLVKLGQVRTTIKSSKIQNTKAPIHYLAWFGRKFEGPVFLKERACPKLMR